MHSQLQEVPAETAVGEPTDVKRQPEVPSRAPEAKPRLCRISPFWCNFLEIALYWRRQILPRLPSILWQMIFILEISEPAIALPPHASGTLRAIPCRANRPDLGAARPKPSAPTPTRASSPVRNRDAPQPRPRDREREHPREVVRSRSPTHERQGKSPITNVPARKDDLVRPANTVRSMCTCARA